METNFNSLLAIPVIAYFALMLAVSSTLAQEPTSKGILVKSLSFVARGSLLAGMGLHSMPGGPSKEGIYPFVGWIQLWSKDDGGLQHTIYFEKNERPQHSDTSRDGTRVAVIFYEPLSKDKRPHGLGCYSLPEKNWLWKWKWNKDEIEGFPKAVKLLPDGRRILVLGYQSIRYYDVETGRKVHEWKGLLKDYGVWTHAVRTSYVSPTGRYLIIWQEKPWEGIALGGANKYVTVWDLEVGKEISRWKKPKYECQIATFSPDERSIIFGCKDGHIREWSIKDRCMVREMRLKLSEPKWVLSIVFSPESKHVAVGVGAEAITMVDHEKLKEIHKFDRPGRGGFSSTIGEQYPMTFSSDGEYFALWDKDRICLYATSTWEQKWCVVPRPPGIPTDVK